MINFEKTPGLIMANHQKSGMCKRKTTRNIRVAYSVQGLKM